MEYNKNFGKIVDQTSIMYAPADLEQEQLEQEGWLPIVDNAVKDEAGSEHVHIATSWQVADGHIEKVFETRSRASLQKKEQAVDPPDGISSSGLMELCKDQKYYKAKIIELMGNSQTQFLQCLQNEHQDLLAQFQNASIFLGNCEALKQCIDIYSGLFSLTPKQIYKQLLEPSVLSEEAIKRLFG